MNGTMAREVGPGAAGERPVLHCYFREHLFMTTREAADIRARFVVFAERQGYQLGKIFTERAERCRTPSALSSRPSSMTRRRRWRCPASCILRSTGHPSLSETS
jgi:hypothetical protein